MAEIRIDTDRETGKRSDMIYGHFLEHFHRQVYGGLYDPNNALSDDEGMREDVIEAMRRIKVPILRWPGGCFASAYHWKYGVGRKRQTVFDKAWRVEEPNLFGTDEYISLCRKVGCKPYICTNAGTGSAEEMSDWVEYCNLASEGKYAGWRIENGNPDSFDVKYWSIGNENYGSWEIGAKRAEEWPSLVKESAKMMKHVDPTIELSAAAITDVDWTLNLIRACAPFLDWISIHEYWDMMAEEHKPASYDVCIKYCEDVGHSVRKIRGILETLGLEKQIKVAFDEWNLRSWHHPNVLTVKQGITKEEYILPRDKNDDNSTYTMADAVFAACFLNEMNRNCDLVGMANFSPIVNTTGCIYSYPDGIVLRSTYYVFELYVRHLGDIVLNSWTKDNEEAGICCADKKAETGAIDAIATKFSGSDGIAIAAVNKSKTEHIKIDINITNKNEKTESRSVLLNYLNGPSADSYNDVGRTEIEIKQKSFGIFKNGMSITLEPHSVNIIEIR
ncbi:MAG: alpha-N-arabinofuranosidase [Lachnospiraceae bacterium]|jgi:alpha-N-arabinofuranosidase|nr:alpha-N-arabinofuranosidase [Lachnospiraceae bacterium]